MPTRRTTLLATVLGPLATPGLALAQSDWPNRPVRMVVPWPPGGSTDVLARLLADQLQQRLGQPFQVENRPGAGGNIGTDAMVKSAPDGYTMGPVTVGGWTINQFLFSRMPYEPDRDLQPITMHWSLPNVFAVSAQHNPAQNLQQFIEWARRQPRGVSFGSPGVGTTAHLSGSWFSQRLNIDGQHVPFRGAAQILPALFSGDLTFEIGNLASYVPTIQEGRIRALAVTGAERWPTLPEVPTMAQAGVADFVVESWCAMAFPAGVPRPILERANAAMRAVHEDPAIQERFLRAGARALSSSPEQVWERVRAERPRWQEMVRISGARME
jgi:tripartite-type tricarboxylate transporter receptor subunit TctC